MAFVLPTIVDNADESWGPSSSHFPAALKDIPYAHYNKADKIERVAEWYDAPASTDSRFPNKSSTTSANLRRNNRDYNTSASNTNNAFGYVHDEDEKSFSLVDHTGGAVVKRGGGGIAGALNRSRGGLGGRGGYNTAQRGGAGRGGQRGGRGGQRGGYNNGRMGYRDWDKQMRIRESSIAINPSWTVLEEIEFSRLSKLSLTVQEPETLSAYGILYGYDKSYDRVNTKNEKKLVHAERDRFYPPVYQIDPVIEEYASKDAAQVFVNDSVLSLLMCAPRSVNSWDIVLTRTGNKLYLDRRSEDPDQTENCPEILSVNENAADPPSDNADDVINSAGMLAYEATAVNFNFACQVVTETKKTRHDLGGANPFPARLGDTASPLSSVGYRYRKFNLSTVEDEPLEMIVRTEVDGVIKATTKGEKDSLITIKTLLNAGSGTSTPAADWKSKLDAQRGAVVAGEMKNNSAKLARWAVQSILAGAEQMKMGYIARVNPKDPNNHTILGTQWYKPKEFAAQMNLSLANGWGIVRAVVDLCLKQPEGQYILVKDPNKTILRLYAVGSEADAEEAGGELAFEEEAQEEA